MTELDHFRRSVAEWAECKLREAATMHVTARDASLAIMDAFICPPHILVDRDLWISADYREWCIHLRRADENIAFFVNELTLSHLAQKMPR